MTRDAALIAQPRAGSWAAHTIGELDLVAERDGGRGTTGSDGGM